MTAHENAETPSNQHIRTSDEIIQESSLESFPASDPPAWVYGKDKPKQKEAKPNVEREEPLPTAHEVKELSLTERVMTPVRKILRSALRKRTDTNSDSKPDPSRLPH